MRSGSIPGARGGIRVHARDMTGGGGGEETVRKATLAVGCSGVQVQVADYKQNLDTNSARHVTCTGRDEGYCNEC